MARWMLLAAALACIAWAQPERDRAIEAEIQKRLEKSIIKQDGIQVRVQGGVAYWSGRTAVPQRKGAATRMARSAGAVRVVNNIRVTTANTPPPKASQQRSKEPPPRSEPQSEKETPRTEAPPSPPRRVKVQWRAVRP